MTESRSRRDVMEAYAAASARLDVEAQAALRHPEWMVEWPQSGERVITSEHFARIIEAYPGGAPRVEVTKVVGGEDRWVLTPGNTVVRVDGSGDFWWGEWSLTYPDGQSYHVISLTELRDGLVYRERVYWAPPFEAPDWRRPFVELPED